MDLADIMATTFASVSPEMSIAEAARHMIEIDTGAAAVIEDSSASLAPRPTVGQLALWISLAACASVLLVSITNHMSQNVAPIPLLWVVPLAIYLLTFILAFESDKIYQRWIFVPWVAPALGWR